MYDDIVLDDDEFFRATGRRIIVQPARSNDPLALEQREGFGRGDRLGPVHRGRRKAERDDHQEAENPSHAVTPSGKIWGV